MSARTNDGRRKNWFWLDNVVIDEYARRLKPMALAAYVYLCRRANENGQCWPSQRTMAEDLGIDRGTARSAVKQLVREKLTTVEIRRNDDGSHNSTLYTLLDVSGGGSIAQGGGSIAQGGSNSPEENSIEENSGITPSGDGKPSAFPLMAQYADLLDEAMDLSSKERGKLASAIQKKLDAGTDPKKIRAALCRMVARRNEGHRLELADVMGDPIERAARRKERAPDPVGVSTAGYRKFGPS